MSKVRDLVKNGYSKGRGPDKKKRVPRGTKALSPGNSGSNPYWDKLRSEVKAPTVSR